MSNCNHLDDIRRSNNGLQQTPGVVTIRCPPNQTDRRRGPTGHIGYRGHTGYRGSTGPTGRIGYRGHTGETGSTGVTGQTGPTGSHGPTGSRGHTGQFGAASFNFTTVYKDIDYPTSNSIRKNGNNYNASYVLTLERYNSVALSFQAPIQASNSIVGLNKTDTNDDEFCHSIRFLENSMDITVNGGSNEIETLSHIPYSQGDLFTIIVENAKVKITQKNQKNCELAVYF